MREDLIQTGYMGEFTTSTVLGKGVKAFSPIGVLGDPKKASREAGEKMINDLVEAYAGKIEKELSKRSHR